MSPYIVHSLKRGLGWLLMVSAVLQWLAILLFVLLAWPRVKERYHWTKPRRSKERYALVAYLPLNTGMWLVVAACRA